MFRKWLGSDQKRKTNRKCNEIIMTNVSWNLFLSADTWSHLTRPSQGSLRLASFLARCHFRLSDNSHEFIYLSAAFQKLAHIVTAVIFRHHLRSQHKVKLSQKNYHYNNDDDRFRLAIN